MKLRGKIFNVRWMAAIMAVFFIVVGSQMAFALDAADYPLGDIPLDQATYQKLLKPMPQDRADAAPASYDARNDGIVTPAKDQGSCGSCWAFASVGAMESHILKQSGPTYDLSEQQQNRCNTAMYGCSGGSSTAPQYWETTGPITEACYPYTPYDGPCSHSCTEMDYRIDGFYTVTATAAAFKQSCYDDGPSYWRFDVYSDFYDFWDYSSPGDVYTNTSGSRLGGHAVLIIGWDDAKGAFLCKNSWGQNAGPNNDGTFWIAYSGHSNNLGFGMSNFNLANSGPEWNLCFYDTNYSSVRLEMNIEGTKLRGQAIYASSASFPAPLTGYVHNGTAYFAINYLGEAGFRFYKINVGSKTGETWGVSESGLFYDTPHSATLNFCAALPESATDETGAAGNNLSGSNDTADGWNMCFYASDYPGETLEFDYASGVFNGQNTYYPDPTPVTGAVGDGAAFIAIGYYNDNLRMYAVSIGSMAGEGWAILGTDSSYYSTPHPITLSACTALPVDADETKKDGSGK